jgi:threonyl-tRNA synthetase
LRNEKITYKIREHSIQRVPYLLVIGDREKETKQVAVRNQKGEDLGSMTVESLIKILKKEICDKS